MRPICYALFYIFCTLHVSAKDMIEGPVEADIVRVRDGDSIDVVARVWPGQDIRVSVRIRGIDAPELNARCDNEKHKALAAREKLKQILDGGRIRLYKISGGKYFGRVLSAVQSQSGEDIKTAMLQSGLVRPYQGRKRASWCPENAALKR